MSLSKPLTLRHLCHLLNNILGPFYHRHIVFFTISFVKDTKCYLPGESAPVWPRNRRCDDGKKNKVCCLKDGTDGVVSTASTTTSNPLPTLYCYDISGSNDRGG